MNGTSFKVIWPITWPLRIYLDKSPLPRGKGFITRRLLRPLLPQPPAEFCSKLPGGGEVMLQFTEDLGVSTLVHGGFESREIELLQEYAAAGTTAIDIGANVGIFTISLAQVVGERGAVWAFEPHPDTAVRLQRNVSRNRLVNARVFEMALGKTAGEVTLGLGTDAAYHSTTGVRRSKDSGHAIKVRADTLDSVWALNGAPQVSVVKVDVEGAEADVLAGSSNVLVSCRPFLLVEANDDIHRRAIEGWLSQYGYAPVRVSGIMPWNFAYAHRSSG